MNYNFDEVIDRRGTCSEKVDGMVNVWGKSDLIPMWVADMDFATPPFILEAIRKRCEHPVLGYTFRSDDYYQSIIGWVKKRYGMSVEKEEINFVPGIVPGLGMAINCFTKPGDKIMIMPPVYHLCLAGDTQQPSLGGMPAEGSGRTLSYGFGFDSPFHKGSAGIDSV